ncbi:hypothetical protein DFJ73DRAFT_757885 [Zopfochytrium polystomum]|nr:hypothetical protein DFJ73DRAFT_757885 [Zopfochytrium polystomum]
MTPDDLNYQPTSAEEFHRLEAKLFSLVRTSLTCRCGRSFNSDGRAGNSNFFGVSRLSIECTNKPPCPKLRFHAALERSSQSVYAARLTDALIYLGNHVRATKRPTYESPLPQQPSTAPAAPAPGFALAVTAPRSVSSPGSRSASPPLPVSPSPAPTQSNLDNSTPPIPTLEVPPSPRPIPRSLGRDRLTAFVRSTPPYIVGPAASRGPTVLDHVLRFADGTSQRIGLSPTSRSVLQPLGHYLPAPPDPPPSHPPTTRVDVSTITDPIETAEPTEAAEPARSQKRRRRRSRRTRGVDTVQPLRASGDALPEFPSRHAKRTAALRNASADEIPTLVLSPLARPPPATLVFRPVFFRASLSHPEARKHPLHWLRATLYALKFPYASELSAIGRGLRLWEARTTTSSNTCQTSTRLQPPPQPEDADDDALTAAYDRAAKSFVRRRAYLVKVAVHPAISRLIVESSPPEFRTQLQRRPVT